jgi:hypothetical protein
MATIHQPVTQRGVYVIKVVNLNLGPLQFTSNTATEEVSEHGIICENLQVRNGACPASFRKMRPIVCGIKLLDSATDSRRGAGAGPLPNLQISPSLNPPFRYPRNPRLKTPARFSNLNFLWYLYV